jgi:RecA-family ATPase
MSAFKSTLIPSMAEAEADQAASVALRVEEDAKAQAEASAQQRRSEIEAEVNWLDVGSMATHLPPPLDFAFPGMLAGTVASLVSPGGAGKSFLALELAALIASSVDVAGLSGPNGWGVMPGQGKVLYIALEDTPAVLSHRIYDIAGAVSQAMQGSPIQKGLTRSMRLASIPAGMDLLEDGWKEWFLTQCEGTRLVVIDTFRLAHMGDENSAGEMARVMSALGSIAARTGASILFLHHTSKAAATEGRVDSQQAARGSSVIVDNARGGFYLQKMTRDESESLINVSDPVASRPVGEHRWQFVRFGISKANAGRPWEDIWLRRNEQGVLRVVKLDPVNQQSAPKGRRKTSPKLADDI